MHSINKFLIVFSVVIFSALKSSEHESKDFCVKKVYHLVKQRTNPESAVTISELEKNIEITFQDCSKVAPKLMDDVIDYSIKQQDRAATEYLFRKKLEPELYAKLKQKEFMKNTVITVGTAAAGLFLGHVFHSEKKKQ